MDDLQSNAALSVQVPGATNTVSPLLAALIPAWIIG
jgi:hypothetical protein